MGNTSTSTTQPKPTFSNQNHYSKSDSTHHPVNSLFLTAFPSHSYPSFKRPPKTSDHSISLAPKGRNSLLNVNNGVTGIYISSRICKIAAEFWYKHIDKLSHQYQLEVGCSICFSMLSTNKDIIKHMTDKRNSLQATNIEKMSLKYLDMIAWFIRHLASDNADLLTVLNKLGAMHQAMGINIKHFDGMLQAMHETFVYYFKTIYTMDVRHAMDEIFTLSAQIMTGQHLQCELNDITTQLEDPFLESLDLCLESVVGTQYLYRFLAAAWCDEIVLFLKSLALFKSAVSDQKRLIIARDITKTCIRATATFALNLSYEDRADAMRRMDGLEKLFTRNEDVVVPMDLFVEVEREVRKLIWTNHWNKFVDEMKILQAKSCM
eukprot:250249_1